MKNLNEKINAKEYKAVELSDKELAQVSGGKFIQGNYDTDDYMSGYNFGPCSERDCLMISNSCLNPLCSKLRNDGVVYSCQDGPQRGLIPVPCN